MQRHHYRTHVTLAALALGGLLPALGAVPAAAAPPVLRPGDLDPSFGTAGKVLTSFGVYDSTGIASSVVLQPDGRIVVAGLSNGNGNFDFALARYGVDGSLDASFGTGGTVLTDFGGGYAQALAVAVVLQPDGRIVAAGVTNDARAAQGPLSVLARYNVNGSLDTTFGTGGRVLTDFGDSGGTVAVAVAVQSDGQIVAASGSTLARFNVNGSLDASFGTGGKVEIDPSGPGAWATALALQSDGRIVVAGWSLANGNYDFALARYNANGSPDPSFGTGGKVLTDLGGGGANALALQPDGRIVAAGSGLARYNIDGSLDTAFGTGGKVTDLGGSALALQTDGRIVVAGASIANGMNYFFALERLNVNGSLDTNFGTSGNVLTSFGDAAMFAGARAVAVQPDGQIVAAGGFTDANSSAYFALARYQGR